MRHSFALFPILFTLFFLDVKTVSGRDTTKVNKADWFENPGYSRYVMMPSVIPLRKGTGYYQTQYGIAHSVRYGITNGFNVSGGTELVSLLARKSAPAYFYLNAQYSDSIGPKLYAGGGVVYLMYTDGYFTDGNEPSHYGAAFGMITYGGLNSNVTLGCGWSASSVSRGYYNQPFNFVYERDKGIGKLPLISLSGMWRLSNGFTLVMDNWIIPQKSKQSIPHADPTVPPTVVWELQPEYFISYGFRITTPRVYFDAGLITSNRYKLFSSLGLPYAMLTINFGGMKKEKPAEEEVE